MRRRCRCAVSRITRIRLFPLFFHNGCSQSSRFPTAGQGERSSGNEIARAHERVHVQNVRDFPQTKLDNGINSPFLLNEHGYPPFLFQVLAKNSLMKNIFEEEKKFDSRT